MINNIIGRFSHVRKTSKGWQAKCPAHNDGGPSLTITEGRKGILMHCHAGCSITDVCAAIGLHPKDLFYDKAVKVKSQGSDLDDYIIAIARSDLAAGKSLTPEEQALYINAVRNKL